MNGALLAIAWLERLRHRLCCRRVAPLFDRVGRVAVLRCPKCRLVWEVLR